VAPTLNVSQNSTFLVHPVAELFPLMEGAAFDALVEDIRLHGLSEPILRDAGGRIIDGRNRLRACQFAQVSPRFATWVGDDPTPIIVSRNLHRRHLSESQRAMVAAKIATLPKGRHAPIGASTQTSAADLLNVSRRAVQRARSVIDQGTPEVVQAIERGDLAVSTAITEIKAGRDPLSVHFSSESPEHYTPTEVLDAVIACLGAIDLDPCSNKDRHVPAAKHYTAADDGLVQPWHGRVFMNPPYGRVIDHWVKRLVESIASGEVTEAIALVPARVDTEWFARFRDGAVCMVHGRLTFIGNTDPAPFPSLIIYLGPEVGHFYRTFNAFGDCWQRMIEDVSFAE
jgi:phage N-6-adenine-methyltransferase